MSDAQEQSAPSPKTRIQLPPLQVPKRRVSASWTENLEPSMDIKSPPAIKSPEEKPGPSRAFFSRPTSEIRPSSEEEIATLPKPTPSPLSESQAEDSKIQREDSREEKPEKRGRRGSIGTIKDQLMKFKMKAGKVLEDVHDRLVEDHSSVAVAPLSLPATPSQDLTSGAEMDEASSIDGRAKSPTLSQSSKRTSTSAELKASMRSKLRKQAEQTVERKRGSVHLAKRLQRRLTIHQEEGPTEGELQSVDEQIEKTLKIGARFLQEQASLNPPDDVQYAFFVDDYEKEPPPRVIGSIMNYRRAEMVDDDENQGLLTYYDARPSDLEAERPMTSSIMEQRLSPAFFTNGRLRTIEESQYTKPLKTIQREDVPYNYVKAEPWETFVDEVRGSDYVQLDIFIGSVSMEQHPLCGDEDKIVGRLHALYEEQVKRINEMTDTLVNIENLPSGANPSALREHVDSLYRDIRRAAEGLRREYGELENCRNRQGYSTSPLKYTIDEEDESSSLLGKLTMDGPVTPSGALPQAERSRLDLMKKTSVHVILHFNDMFVCKSESLPLNDFQYRFDQLFNLEIVSEPKTITATIIEKSGTTKKTIAKVNIPLPSDSEEDSLQPHHIPFASTENSISGFILAHAKWSSEARARRRESAAPAQPNEDTPFSIIPPGVRLVSDEEFDSNPRWDALERRARKRNGNERIPIDASDIDTSTSAHLDERRHRPSFRTAIDGMRALGLAQAVKLRTRLLEREQDVSTMSYSEIVREEPLPGLFGAIGSLFGPADLSRKLKPMRKMPDRQQNFSPSSFKLVINIQAATNLPTRTDGILHSMVEIRFQGTIKTTAPVSGKHPNWQHGATLPVQDTTDPKSIIDCIQLNIYDQIVSTLDKDDRLTNVVHEQLLRRLIGWIEVPFSTVYGRGKIDGWLRLQRPLFFTGYSMPDRPSYLKVLIAFDPPLAPPRMQPPDRLESVESEKIVAQCQAWTRACTAVDDNRRYAALVTDINGKAILACRFLAPVRPPQSVPHPGANPRRTVEVAARLVSQIPFVADPALFPGCTDLWTTIEKFLSLGCGDEEEHAVLLCCWLLSLQIPSCLVLGFALPEGSKAAYVFINLPDGIYLVNPCDGSVYPSTDAMCPLASVGTVITPKNAYGNIQSYGHPSQLQFDLNRTSDWRPLFDRELDEIQSIQAPVVNYAEVSEDALIELRSSIEREIKVRFDEARKYGIPQWNLMASRLFREILQDENVSLDTRLARLRESYTVTVTAFSMPYKSVQDCVAAVLRCGLHATTSSSSQFALAVHLQPAFGHVIGCGIALGLLTLRM